MRELWIETWRSIVAHRLRFGLTSLGIAWGALMLTYLSSSMLGFEAHFEREFSELGPKIVFMGPGSVLKDRVGQRGARAVELEVEDVLRLAALDSVEAVSPEVELWSMPVRNGRRTKLLKVTGYDEDAAAIRNFVVEVGRFITPLDVARGARVACLGAEAAERLFGLGGPEKALGASILIDGHRFRVVGVLERKGDQLMDSGDPDDLNVVVPYSTAQRWLTKDDRVPEFIMAPTTKELSWAAITHVRQLMGLHKGYDPGIETALWAFNIQDSLNLIRGIFLGLRVFMLAAGLVTLFVGAVGVMNIMLVVVGERTQEIGVRKAVGATGRRIFLQFLAEATVVSTFAGLAGAGVGLAMVQGMRFVLPEGSSYISPPLFDPVTTAALTIALIVVGIVSGVVPAVRAARTPPAEALRAF